jgi:sn1-specific diacylglycerol lipase
MNTFFRCGLILRLARSFVQVDSQSAGPSRCIALHLREPVFSSVAPCAHLPDRCITDASLATLASKMIVSFVYSHDVISRLSLGSVRDIKNAAMWLCEANERTDGEEGYASVTQRARAWTDGRGSNEDPDWVSMF